MCRPILEKGEGGGGYNLRVCEKGEAVSMEYLANISVGHLKQKGPLIQ